MEKLNDKKLEKTPLLEIEENILELKNKITHLTVGFWNKEKEITDIKHHTIDFLNYCKLNYAYHISILDPTESDEELFSWKNNFMKIWCIGIDCKDIGNRRLLFFATTSTEDEFIAIDGVKETSVPKFYHLDSLEKIDFLINNKVIPDIKNSLITNSVNSFASVDGWIEDWFINESKSIEKLATPSKELFNFNKAIIRAKRYNFEEMLNKINNEQFTIEFDECLYAYNNEKWFVCAAGLGGVLEHLLYLILEKNNMLDSNFPDDATAKIYVEYLSRRPIKLRKREKTQLKSLFLIRNSVSHYNQGFTSKDQCTNLMNGIKDVFNNYYIKDFNLENN